MQERARELRRELTPAEKKLWAYLRGDQLDGWHWRKQHAVGTYIVDFFCAKAKLVIEVDGDTHAEPEQAAYDAERTRWLTEEKGYTVIRFTNHEVFQQTEAVVSQVIEQCQTLLVKKDQSL
jgi:very-short-patch-repair endonuclease